MSYGIPEELTYDNLSRLYPCVKSEMRRNPINGSVFQSGDIQLRINKQERSFLNPNTACINFRVTYNIRAGATAVAGSGTENLLLLGNALSFFSNQVTKPSSGMWQDTIAFPGLISNTLLNLTTNPVEKTGMVSFGFNSIDGFGGYMNTGDRISNSAAIASNATESVIRTYSVPILGILNTNKLIPLFCDDIQIDLTLNTLSNFTFILKTGSTTFDISIDEVELVADILTMEQQGFNEILKMYPNGMSYKTESYLYGSSNLPANGVGTYDITYSHNLKSLKRFMWWSSPSGIWENNYAGVNPNLQNYQLLIGSIAYPSLPVKAYSIAEVFYQLQKSFGAFYSTAHCGSIDRSGISKCSLRSAGSKFTAEFSNYQSGTPTLPQARGDTSAWSHKYYSCIDVEQLNNAKESLYSGISTNGSSNLFRINVASPLANVIHNVTYYSVYDAVITFDWVNSKILQIS